MIKNPILENYWNEKVSRLATLTPKPISDALKERHRLYSLGLMAITHHYWNGLKKGRDGEYPWNPNPATAGGAYLRDDYRGHNIAAYAVDRRGFIIDFEFNHNKLLNSSAEHAEARLVRRIYGLTQISDSWDVNSPTQPPADDYNTFEEVTLYTTLESCSQCSGIMALARLREVVFLQTDPGMYMIGNILRNLTENTGLEAPRPVPASSFGFPYFTKLDDAYEVFTTQVATHPFYTSPAGKTDTSPSITSFLCTNLAYQIYGDAARALADLESGKNKLLFPDAKPVDRAGNEVTNGLTNAETLREVAHFRNYAAQKGRRATPHAF
ncbi:MAG TPA: deaminase [Verrucomicrobiales bacterium]|nr:deaminase [Verrucomicrobiales bacterium]